MTTVSGAHYCFAADRASRFLNTSGRMSHGVNLKVCGLCNCQDDQLKVCGRCKTAWYCSPDHQKQHWKQHKPFCKPCKPENGEMPGDKKAKKVKRPNQQTPFPLDRSLLEAMTYSQNAGRSDYEFQFQGRHGDVHSGRSLPLEPDLSTPIDSGTMHRPRTPSLFHVQISPDSQSLEEGGIGQERFSIVLKLIIEHLNEYGVCAVDSFLGKERAEQIYREVGALHSQGVFRDGQVVSRQLQSQARGMVRGDKITWVTGAEPNCSGIGQLVSVVDSLIAKANKHQDNGELANYNITWRTRAMVACYPGEDTHYVKHVDNPNGDGRCITAIYYVNKGWSEEDGGLLRIFPEGRSDKVAEIMPIFDRMLFFWSDRRNPHEVLPAKTTRYAITVWYLDQKEREDYLARVHSGSANT